MQSKKCSDRNNVHFLHATAIHVIVYMYIMGSIFIEDANSTTFSVHSK